MTLRSAAIIIRDMPLSEDIKRRMELVRATVNGCPFYRHLSMALVDYDEGKSVLEISVGPEHTNIYGAAHGGVVASIADSASGLALATLLDAGQSTVTLDLRVNYTATVRQGLIVATGEVAHRGKTTAVGTVRITQNGTLVAVAIVTHFIKHLSPVNLEEKS